MLMSPLRTFEIVTMDTFNDSAMSFIRTAMSTPRHQLQLRGGCSTNPAGKTGCVSVGPSSSFKVNCNKPGLFHSGIAATNPFVPPSAFQPFVSGQPQTQARLLI